MAHFLAGAGVASRRASEKLIKAGEVEVNGRVIRELGTRVDPATDRVCYRGRELKLPELRYYLLHKPKGYTCSAADPHAEKLAIELLELSPAERVFSIGRLDRDSEGLLLFTNDGQLANRLTHPRYGVEKTYLVNFAGRIAAADLRRLEQGVEDDGELLQARSAEVLKRSAAGGILKIVVGEGRKREVRRMCRRLGCRVERLLRTGFGPLELGEFRPGFWRELTPDELLQLQAAAQAREN